jgi:hypothetical protein
MWAKKLLLSVKTYGKLEVPYHTINRLTCLGTPIRICTQYKVECDVTCGLNWRKQTSVAVQDWTNDTSFSHHITGIRMLCTLAQQAFMHCLYLLLHHIYIHHVQAETPKTDKMNVNPLSSTEWMEPKLLITAPT